MKRKIKEIKRIARDILNDRYIVPMGAFAIAGLVPTILELPFSMSASRIPSVQQYVISFLAEYLILLITLVISAGVSLIHLNMTRQKEYRLSQILEPFRHGTERYFAAAFLLSLLELLSCMPLGAGALFLYYTDVNVTTVCVLVLTAVISVIAVGFVLLNYNFVFYFLLDYPEMKVSAAFYECRKMMKHNKGRLLYLLCSFIGWGFLILCSLGVAALWCGPYMTETLVIFYLDCTEELNRIPVRQYENNMA